MRESDTQVAGQYRRAGWGFKRRAGGVGLGDDRVKFPLSAWNLRIAATQPLACLLPLQAGTLYIVLMLLFSCLADGHSAAARITLPQIHQILWLGIKSGVHTETERGLSCGSIWLIDYFFQF